MLLEIDVTQIDVRIAVFLAAAVLLWFVLRAMWRLWRRNQQTRSEAIR